MNSSQNSFYKKLFFNLKTPLVLLKNGVIFEFNESAEMFFCIKEFKNKAIHNTPLLDYALEEFFEDVSVDKDIFSAYKILKSQAYNYKLAYIKNEKLLDNIIENFPVPFFYKDANLNYQRYNQAFCDFVGKTKDELNGKSVFELWDEDLANKYNDADKKTLDEVHQIYDSKVKNHKNSKLHNVTFYKDALFDNKGKFDGIIGVILDITQKVEALEELNTLKGFLEKRVQNELLKNTLQDKLLRDQSRLAQMGEILDIIIHQWKQPLSTLSSLIIGLRFSLLANNSSNEELEKSFDKIDSLIGHINQTSIDFRKFFDINTKTTSVKSSKLVEDSLKMLDFFSYKSDIQISTMVLSDSYVDVTENQFHHVILNLIKNTHDAASKKGIKKLKILISCDTDGDYECISVEDNAGGIDEDIIDSIFEAYSSTNTNSSNAGIGLYMCKKIVEENSSGILKVSNTKTGAVFKIYLKRVDQTK